MRKYAYLKKPFYYNGQEAIVRVMLYEAGEGVYLFGYSSLQAVQSSFDCCYASLADLLEEWQGRIDERGWIELEDPLPDCQHDAFIPLRVKGRATGKPEWGKYETLTDGQWVAFEPGE